LTSIRSSGVLDQKPVLPRTNGRGPISSKIVPTRTLPPVFATRRGVLFKGDCLKVLPLIATESINTIFADPPFNIGKKYGRLTNDRLPELDYLDWCDRWIKQCARVLRQGGAFFLYNLPKWNIRLASLLQENGLLFRHWIVVDIKLGLPIPGRLYPSHYSLLYFTKGPAKTFHRIRIPIKTCRHCGGDIKDYGGHRHSLNPKGLNLTDVWADISPVRHWTFKSPKRKANALSTKLLDRIIEMSTDPGDIVLDPFGGSGTTFAVCEKKKRRWIGIELESTGVIAERLEKDDIQFYKNEDFTDK
jgi:site-specific DNA-methyltransferase (adenine-specific)